MKRSKLWSTFSPRRQKSESLKPKYKYKNDFLEEYRLGDFEPTEEDLEELDIDDWVPITTTEVEEFKRKEAEEAFKVKKKSCFKREYKTIEDVESFYMNQVAGSCSTLEENHKFMEEYRKSHNIQKISNKIDIYKSVDKNKIIQSIILLKEEIEETKKRNSQLSNHIKVLTKARDTSLIALNATKIRIQR